MIHRTFEKFQDSLLSNYEFSLSLPKYSERYFGVDKQFNIWKGDKLLELSKKGEIVNFLSEKDITIARDGSLLGYVRECPDNTFLAHSSYFFGEMDYVEVNGFIDEFHAITYLHEIMIKTFPNKIFSVLPDKLDFRSSPSLESSKYVYSQDLNSQLGSIQQFSTNIWMADSFYHPLNISNLKVLGFFSEFYAVRYLFQVAKVSFPDLICEIPELSWKYIDS